MASRKEYEALFRLNAQLGGGFSRTFQSAQQEFSVMQKEMQALGRTQADISSFQKQQAALAETGKKLEVLQQQYDNIQREIKETEGYSSSLENRLLTKQQQIDKTTQAMEQQTDRLHQMDTALQKAGVNTKNLESESARLSAQIDVLREKQEQATESADTFGKKSTAAFGAVQQAIAAAGIAAALHEIYESYMACVTVSGDFEESMSTVEALSGATSEELAELSAMAKKLGATTKFTARESADAITYMGMAGWKAEEMLAGMDGVLQLAAASGEDLATVSDIVTDNLSAFGLTAGETAHFSDVLASAATNTNTNVSIMGETFKQSASIAGALGYSVEDVAVAVGLMANSGVKGSIAGTALKNTFNGLLEGVTLTGTAFGEYEYSAIRADGTMKSFGSTIEELRGYFNQMTEAEQVNNAMAIAGQRGYNGLLAILNATDEDFASLTASINNCSGAAAKMAAIKMDNMNGQLTLAKSAWDALKMSIGDQFTPVMRYFYEIEAKVFNGISKFVDKHPALIKAVAAFAAVLGGVIAALSGYAVIAKVAAAASALFGAAIPGVNIIMGVAAAVAAVTAAVVGFISAVNAGVPSVKELTEEAQEMKSALAEAKATYDDTVVSTIAASNVADTYINKLDELESAGLQSEDAQRQYQNTLALLLEVMPSLSDSISQTIDEYGRTTYTLDATTDALRANTAAWKENAMQQAYQEQLTSIYSKYSSVLVEAEKNSIGLTKAESTLEEASKKLSSTQARMDELWANAQAQADAYYAKHGSYTDATSFLAQEYYDLEVSVWEYRSEISKAEKTIKNHKKAMDEDAEAVAAAEAEIASAEEAVKSLMDATNNSTDADAAAAAQKEELLGIVGDVTDRITALSEAYTASYETAYQSITGQYALWDEAAKVVATSASSINANMESQITYWQDYNANLARLGERTADIEGLRDMIASFADGSADSVNAVAGMAKANDEELRQMVVNWQTLQKEQDITASSIAELQTNFSLEMEKLQQEFAETVKDMELSDVASESAYNTIRSFIDEAEYMLPYVQAAYARLGDSAARALRGSTYGQSDNYTPIVWNAPGHANGTTYAEDAFIAGEDGPELILGKRGASVFPAQETQRIIDALPGSNQSSKIIDVHFAPVYHLEGVSNAADLEAILAGHDEEMREFILQTLEDAGVDTARRQYQ